MGTATYTVTETSNSGVARQLVVGTRAKSGSSIPAKNTDFPGDAFPDLTFDLPIGATTASATLTVKPNSAVDGNRELEFYEKSRSPTGGSVTFSQASATIVDDDTASQTFFGPTSTSDTGYQNAGQMAAKIDSTLGTGEFKTRVFVQSDGTAVAGLVGYEIQRMGDGRIGGYNVAADGTTSNDGGFNYQAISTPVGDPIRITLSSSGQISLYITDMTTPKKTVQLGAGSRPTFMRYQTGGAAQTVTMTKL